MNNKRCAFFAVSCTRPSAGCTGCRASGTLYRWVLPYGSYLVGRFEDYKDLGHRVGKGWMDLKFGSMVIPPEQVLPVATKVVYVPNDPVDKEGRIHGKGHPVREAVG